MQITIPSLVVGVSFVAVIALPIEGATIYQSNFNPLSSSNVIIGASSQAAVYQSLPGAVFTSALVAGSNVNQQDLEELLHGASSWDSENPNALEVVINGGFEEGESYEVRFCISGEPEGAAEEVRVEVLNGVETATNDPEILRSYTFNLNEWSARQTWCGRWFAFGFTSDGSGNIVLRFDSSSDSVLFQRVSQIHIADGRVAEEAVPENATMSTVLVGILLMMLRPRKRTQK